MSGDNGGGSPAPDKAAVDELVRRELEKLTPAQRESLRQQALDKLLRRRAVQVDGKTTSLHALRRRVDKQRQLFESGAFDETVR